MHLLIIAILALLVALAPPYAGIAIGMAVTHSTGWKNAVLDRQFNGSAGTNFNSGKLQVWTGAAPGASNAPTGTKVWEKTLSADAFAAAASGAINFSDLPLTANAIAAGTMGYWRLIKSGDLETTNTTDERLEGTVTATGGGGDMTVQNTSIANGQELSITSATLTHGG